MSFWSWLNTPAGPPGPVAAHSTLAELIVADALQNGYQDKAALGVAAVFRARQLNADVPASLPVNAAGVTLTDTSGPVMESMLALQDHGQVFWKVVGNRWTVIPNRNVDVRWNTDRTIRVYINTRTQQTYQMEGTNRLVVIPVNRGADDLNGMGWMQSDAIQSVIAIDAYATEYFKNNGNPTGVLSTPGTLTKVEADRLKSQWVDARTVRTPAVLSGGMSWDGTSFSAQDSDWVESHRAGVLDIAAISGVPSHFLASSPSGSALNYSNNDSLWRMYWAQTLKPTYVSRLERAWSDVMGVEVTFDPERLLIASMKDRVYSAAELVRTGFDPADSLDEVGLPPIGHTGEVPVTLQPEQRATT